MRDAFRWSARLALVGALFGSCSELAYAGRTPAPTPEQVARDDSAFSAQIDLYLYHARVLAADSGRALLSGARHVGYLATRDP